MEKSARNAFVCNYCTVKYSACLQVWPTLIGNYALGHIRGRTKGGKVGSKSITTDIVTRNDHNTQDTDLRKLMAILLLRYGNIVIKVWQYSY